MVKHTHLLSACALAWLALGFGLAPSGSPGSVEEFDEFEIYIEINATDGDAGLQGFLDGDAWTDARLIGPDERAVFRFGADRALERQGISEVMWESDEPRFTQYPLSEFLDRFPEGEYRAVARTLENELLESTNELTHDLPAGPEITSHVDGEEVELDGENVVITWNEVTDDFQGGPLGSEIEAYLVVVEFEEKVMGAEIVQVLSIDVVADVFSAEVPADFLLPDREYKIELGAIEESGNRTFTEISINTVNKIPD
jgi:hypothetical protein